MNTNLISTNFFFKNQRSFHRGKVRDIYNIDNKYVIIIACDRLSAFDHVMPKPIPYKGQILNQIAAKMLTETANLVPNWKIASPDPNVTIGHKCEPILIEMIIRGYLAGHAWREYNSGKRELCGVSLPEGLKENDPLPEPIITPSIKENSGHDRDISMSEILASKLLKKKDLDNIEAYTKTLYEAGKKIAEDRGLILVDTKYEFGFAQDGKILLMDEVHTPDSSRYFYIDEYNENLSNHHNQRQLSKEFVRQWLMEQGFQGLKDQKVPEMSDEFIESVTNRYIELYEKVTSDTFVPRSYDNVMIDIENNVNDYLNNNPLN